jgi:hypothetical protein
MPLPFSWDLPVCLHRRPPSPFCGAGSSCEFWLSTLVLGGEFSQVVFGSSLTTPITGLILIR